MFSFVQVKRVSEPVELLSSSLLLLLFKLTGSVGSGLARQAPIIVYACLHFQFAESACRHPDHQHRCTASYDRIINCGVALGNGGQADDGRRWMGDSCALLSALAPDPHEFSLLPRLRRSYFQRHDYYYRARVCEH